MPMIKHLTPTTEEVGDFYNKVNHLLERFQGGSIHYGYWTGPDDDSSYAEASERLTDIVTARLEAGPADRVLDLGCGTGKPAVQLARNTGAKVLGVSISTGDVQLGSQRAAAEGLSDQVTFQHGDAMALDLPEASFDSVLGIELMVHVPDRATVLKQIARVVKPGGRVVLTDFVKTGNEIKNEVVRDGLAETLAAFASPPLAEFKDYPGFVAGAGLVLDEIVDITENTAGYSYVRTLEAMREYAEQHDDLSPELSRMLAALCAPESWDVSEEEMGAEMIIIVVAHRPENSTGDDDGGTDGP
jgi:cyclopropane fatty-acyl-phospholipid synthase-like methyltransferase